MTDLDKSRPYGTVYGSSNGAAYHQDGNLFRPDGRPVGAANPEPAPTVAPDLPVADPAPVVEPPAPDLAAELKALHPSKIVAIMEKRGLTPVTGSGSKAKNIEILLANDS
jgi:hypothetical protein